MKFTSQIKQALQALSIGVFGAMSSATGASALVPWSPFVNGGNAWGTGDNTNLPEYSLGNCIVSVSHETQLMRAGVQLIIENEPGGEYRTSASGVERNDAITQAMVATCLGLNSGDVTNFYTNGADAATYADETYIGFSFELAERVTTAGGAFEAATTYEFSIGERPVVEPPVDDTVDDTVEAIAGFVAGRAANLASNQPGVTRFLMGQPSSRLNAKASDNGGFISGGFSQGNVWGELESSWSGDSSYTLGTFGAHSLINPDLLIGGMLQFDYADDDANNISGTGWMVGPYFVAKLPEQPLYLEGRLLYGQTDNDISPLGTYTDSFETDRVLAQLRATGEYKYQATTLMPLFDVTYTDDEAQTYTDSLGNVIPGQKVRILQAAIGMDFSTPIAVQSGSLDLIGGLSAIHASSTAGGITYEDTRGRAELGLAYGLENGSNLRFGTFYDGIGSDYESRGATLSFDMKF